MARRDRPKRRTSSRARKVKIKGVDLFCGAGGLTRGLESAGIDVVLGVDIDPDCEYPYEANNKARFLLKSVEHLAPADFRKAVDGRALTLLAGCAPCQPFSTYQQGRFSPADERWNLLQHFGRLVTESKPDLVTMENVPRLQKERVFSDFVCALEDEGFYVSHSVVNCLDYGVPQHRQRLVLLASKLGAIELIEPTTPEGLYRTVRDAIDGLPPLEAGEICAKDRLHQASELSPLNYKRIRASKPGGTWRDWDDDLVARCHKKKSGKTYPSVYGRMSWDEPAPTVTTQYYGFGNGRFGHPEQDRAISLREGAIIQSFPRSYKFVQPRAPIYLKSIGRLIGNAVPVNLGKAIGKSIVRHAQKQAASRELYV
jgi:DNA (cytosine-5)-methyltransferase 1